jgi:hypothetical protein
MPRQVIHITAFDEPDASVRRQQGAANVGLYRRGGEFVAFSAAKPGQGAATDVTMSFGPMPFPQGRKFGPAAKSFQLCPRLSKLFASKSLQEPLRLLSFDRADAASYQRSTNYDPFCSINSGRVFMSSKHYRFLLARHAGLVEDDASTLVLKCREDTAAIEKAKRLLSTLRFEMVVVWDGDRQVGMVERGTDKL